MITLSQLDPQLRSLALVGNYLQHWAFMENSLNQAVGNALGLDTAARIVVCKNIQLRDKIKIVKTMVDLTILAEPEDRAKYKSLLTKVSDCSSDRNMIAHDLFMHKEDGDGVMFYVIKAAGNFQVPTTVWSTDKFIDKCVELRSIWDALDELASKLNEADLLKKMLAAQSSVPSEALSELGLQGGQFRQAQELPRSPPANQQKAPESPKTPPEIAKD